MTKSLFEIEIKLRDKECSIAKN